MKIRIPSKNRKKGAALVVTLALVVLVTTLLLAFFVNSTMNGQLEVSSTSRVETGILARSALQLVVDDFKKEMLAGSTSATVGSNRVMQPIMTSGSSMVPSRVLASSSMTNNDAFNNLVKQSVASPFFDAGSAPYNNNGASPQLKAASLVSTDTASRNNRKISVQRWNLPQFLGDSGFTDVSQIPSWFYMDSAGVTVTPSVNIIGRFAYNVYDEGGLINANVAGARPGLSTEQLVKLKGAPVGAVLEGNIPGILDEAAFVQWRNTYSDSGSADQYMKTVLTNSTGFRKPFADDTNPDNEDNRFVSRQDLIRYARLNPTVISTNAPNALAYLTTFSLERNAPSWGPMANAPTMNYLNDSTNSTATNRLTPTAFHLSGSKLKDYDRLGRALPEYTVEYGVPVVRKRFPLNKLAWIDKDGPATIDGVKISDAAIKASFGLEWDSSAKAWAYTESTQKGTDVVIKTLDEVATAGRDPNFFELLKAAILSGSLGREAGDGASQNGTYDRKPDYQIIQIGCNIIDQYRKDDIPTRVKFDTTSATSEYGTLSGVVDLPYINKIYNINYRPLIGTPVTFNMGSGVQDADRSVLGGWIVPEFWRPHARSSLSEALGGDEAIRMRVLKGKLAVTMFSSNDNSGTLPQTDTAATAIKDMAGQILGLGVEKDGFRAIPDIIRSAPATIPPGGEINEDSSGQFKKMWGMSVGFSTFGRTLPPPKPVRGFLKSGNAYAVRRAAITPASITDISMEVASGGEYLPYDIIKNFRGNVGVDPAQRTVPMIGFINTNYLGGDNVNGPDFLNNYIAASGYGQALYGGLPVSQRYDGFAFTKIVPIVSLGRPDPRTDRFGLSSFLGSQMGFLRNSELKGENPSYSDPEKMPKKPSGTVNYVPERGGLRAQQMKISNYGQFGKDAGWLDNHEKTSTSNDGGYDLTGNYPGSLTDNKPRGIKGAVYYKDNDGVQRRALGAYKDYFMDKAERAPIMLNRSFYSAGDLGYVHRGEPWKNLDFYTPESADAGLLDFFTAVDQGEIVEGKININSAPTEVLAAYLQNTVNNEMVGAASTSLVLDAPTALKLATEIKKEVKNRGFVNKAELVTRFADGADLRKLSSSEAGSSQLTDNKATYEAFIRGLSDVVQTRTWNLMIDLIAQKGRLAKDADLESFIVEGERRYWLHVAIDRFTGEVVDQKLEAVYE